MAERKFIGPPATDDAEVPPMKTGKPIQPQRPIEEPEALQQSKELEDNDMTKTDVLEAVIASLIELLVAKRMISVQELEMFMENLMNNGPEALKQTEPQQMAGPQPPKGGQMGAGYPGSADQPSMGSTPGAGQNNLMR